MIVITGPGRSGTSALASAYAQAGVDVGGIWKEEIRAGHENPAVVQLNRRILIALGVSTLGVRTRAPRIEDLPVGTRGAARLRRIIPPETRIRIRRRFENASWNRAGELKLLDWTLVEPVAAQFADEVAALSQDLTVCKDPQFCWTLPVWLRAGAPVEHVVITIRDVAEMVSSRERAGHLRFRRESDARNAMIYAFGVAVTAAADAGVPRTVLQFPDFLQQLDGLAETLPLPDGLTADQMRRALKEVARPHASRSRTR